MNLGAMKLSGDALRYILLGIGATKAGASAWIDNREMQKTWAANAEVIVQRARDVEAAGGDPSTVNPTEEEWTVVRGFENAAYEATQKPLTHEGPAAT